MRLRLVIVEWEDSVQQSGWTTAEPANHSYLCHSVGWIVAETKNAKTLSPNVVLEPDAQRCGDMTIPKSAIRKITVLKKRHWL